MKNKNGLEFHIKSNDYFGTLATILSLISQDYKIVENKGILESVVKDLVYLQKEYKIIKK